MEFFISYSKENKRNVCQISCHTFDYEYIKELIQHLKKRDQYLRVYDHEHTMILMPLTFIYYMESIDNKTFIYTKNAFYRSFEHFSKLKKTYHSFGFRQVNKNTIINIHSIKKVKIASDCRRIITLKNDEKIVVNRAFRNFLDM